MWCYFINPNVATFKYNEFLLKAGPVYGRIIIRLPYFTSQETRVFELTQLLCNRVGIAYSVCGRGYRMDDPEFQSRQGHEILLFSKTCRPIVVPSQPHTQWVPQFVRARRPGPHADPSLSHRAEVNKEWSYSSIRHIRLRDLNRVEAVIILPLLSPLDQQ